MTTKQMLYLALGTIFLLSTILFVGQFYDPEDGDRTLFIKHKPTFKHYFYSPAAHHRFHPTKLSFIEENEERAFQEFKRDMTDNPLPILPIMLMQASLTLLIAGLSSIFFKMNLKHWHLLSHFIVNITITTFGINYILLMDSFISSLIFAVFVVSVNIITVILLIKRKFNSILV